MLGAPEGTSTDPRAVFEPALPVPASEETGALSHAELEERFSVRGREPLRTLPQDHLHLREARGDAVDVDDFHRERRPGRRENADRCASTPSVAAALSLSQRDQQVTSEESHPNPFIPLEGSFNDLYLVPVSSREYVLHQPQATVTDTSEKTWHHLSLSPRGH